MASTDNGGRRASLPALLPTYHPVSIPVSHQASHPSHLPTSHPASLPASHQASLPASHPASHQTLYPASLTAPHPAPLTASQPMLHPASLPATHPAPLTASQPASLPASHPTSHPVPLPASQPASLPASLLSSLPVAFCLQVTTTVIRLLWEGAIPREDATKLPGAGLGNGAAVFTEGSQLLPRHRAVSEDKLWEEILQNLHTEGSGAQGAVTLSGLQLEKLTAAVEAGSQTSKSWDADGKKAASSSPAVVFSCGHHMPRKRLLEEGVRDLQAVLVGEMDMPQSAALLSSQYSHQGLMSVACPQCVLNTISTS